MWHFESFSNTVVLRDFEMVKFLIIVKEYQQCTIIRFSIVVLMTKKTAEIANGYQVIMF